MITNFNEMYDFTVDQLNSLDLEYTIYKHDDIPITDYESDKQAREKYHMVGSPTKSLLLQSKRSGNYYIVLTLPEKRKIDWRQFGKESGLGKLRIASNEQLHEVTGCEPGCLVPFGVNESIDLYIDTSLLSHDKVLFSIGGLTTESLELNTSDLEKLLKKLPNNFHWINIDVRV